MSVPELLENEKETKKYLGYYLNLYYENFDESDLNFDFSSKTNLSGNLFKNCFYKFDKMSLINHSNELENIYKKYGLETFLKNLIYNPIKKKYTFIIKKIICQNEKILTISVLDFVPSITFTSFFYDKNVNAVIGYAKDWEAYKLLNDFVFAYSRKSFTKIVNSDNNPYNCIQSNFLKVPLGYSLKRFKNETEFSTKFYFDKIVEQYCKNKKYTNCLTYIQSNFKKIGLNHNTVCLIFDHFINEQINNTATNDCYKIIDYYINELGILPTIDRLTLSILKYMNIIEKEIFSNSIYIDENKFCKCPIIL